MRFASVLGTAALIGAAAAAEETKASDVVDLTPESFGSFVHNSSELLLVEFYAPWCGHCKALAPEYETAATALKEKDIKLAKVDCQAHGDLCQEHGVSGYPTLKIFRKGEASPYGGPRKSDGIVSYMVKQSLPAVTTVTAADHDDFKGADKVVVLAYVSSAADAPAPSFSAVADKHRDDYLFGITTDEALAKAANVTAPAIVMYKKFDDGRSDFPSEGIQGSSVEVLSKWISENSLPLVGEITGDTYQSYSDTRLPIGWLFLDPASPDKDALIDAVKPVAQKHKGALNIVWIDTSKYGDHADSLNIPVGKWPAFVIQELKTDLKYPLEDAEPSFATIDDLADKYVAGKLTPKLKSEPIPETNDEPVTVVVGQQYDQIVMDQSRDVVIEFYAPWCGHCKRLAPTWDQLGEHYAAAKDKITIAKMDATVNDLRPGTPFKIEGFPTIKIRPAGSSEFIDYTGDRSFESLTEWISKNAKNEIVIPEKVASKEPEQSSTQATAAETPAPDHGAHDHDEL